MNLIIVLLFILVFCLYKKNDLKLSYLFKFDSPNDFKSLVNGMNFGSSDSIFDDESDDDKIENLLKNITFEKKITKKKQVDDEVLKIEEKKKRIEEEKLRILEEKKSFIAKKQLIEEERRKIEEERNMILLKKTNIEIKNETPKNVASKTLNNFVTVKRSDENLSAQSKIKDVFSVREITEDRKVSTSPILNDIIEKKDVVIEQEVVIIDEPLFDKVVKPESDTTVFVEEVLYAKAHVIEPVNGSNEIVYVSGQPAIKKSNLGKYEDIFDSFDVPKINDIIKSTRDSYTNAFVEVSENLDNKEVKIEEKISLEDLSKELNLFDDRVQIFEEKDGFYITPVPKYIKPLVGEEEIANYKRKLEVYGVDNRELPVEKQRPKIEVQEISSLGGLFNLNEESDINEYLPQIEEDESKIEIQEINANGFFDLDDDVLVVNQAVVSNQEGNYISCSNTEVSIPDQDITIDDFKQTAINVTKQKLVVEKQTPKVTNVFDCDGNPINKEQFLDEYMKDIPNIFDSNSKLLSKSRLDIMINKDDLVIFDDKGIHVVKLMLQRDISKLIKIKEKETYTNSNIFNEFNKPVNVEELVKEYNKSEPNIFYSTGKKINKENLVDEIKSDKLYVSEYGKKISKEKVVISLNDMKTNIFTINGDIINKSDLIIFVQNNYDMYDKFGNHMNKDELFKKIDYLIVFDELKNKVSKVELRKDVFEFINVYDKNCVEITKEEFVNMLDDGNIEFYNKKMKKLSNNEIIKIIKNKDIKFRQKYQDILFEKISNVFDSNQKPFSRNNFIKEYRTVLPKIFNENQKRFNKDNIIDYVKDSTIKIFENGISVDPKGLAVELKINTLGVFTKEKEEMCKEEFLCVVSDNDYYNFKGKKISRKELVNKLEKEDIVIYDFEGNNASKDILKELNNNYIGVYDFFQHNLTKEECIEHIVNGKILYDDSKMMLSSDELLHIMNVNNIDLSSYNLSVDKQFHDFEIKNIDDNLIVVSHDKSFEAMLHLSNEFNQVNYVNIKNILLSFDKVRSKITWDGESFYLGRKVILKLQIKEYINVSIKDVDYTITSQIDFNECHLAIEDLLNSLEVNIKEDYIPEGLTIKSIKQLFEEDLIKEIIDDEKYCNIAEINIDTFSGNNIKSISKDVLVDIHLNEDLYNQICSKEDKIGRKGIVCIDTISKYFSDGELVNLESLKEKNLIEDNVYQVRCVARGILNKKLSFELDEYCKDAIKMILFSQGEILI